MSVVERQSATIGHTPVRASLGVLVKLTESQVERLYVLVDGFKPQGVRLISDSWTKGVLFTLVDAREETILNGLIEEDGSCHT